MTFREPGPESGAMPHLPGQLQQEPDPAGHSRKKLDPVIGREQEIQRVIQILSRRTKNNPCLIGEPGVEQNSRGRGTGPDDCVRQCA